VPAIGPAHTNCAKRYRARSPSAKPFASRLGYGSIIEH